VPDETATAKLSVRCTLEAVRGVGYGNEVFPLRFSD